MRSAGARSSDLLCGSAIPLSKTVAAQVAMSRQLQASRTISVITFVERAT